MLPVFTSETYKLPSKSELLTFATNAEELGFHSIWVPENPTVREKGTFIEPLTTLGLVSAVTSRLKLGTSVLLPPFRHPVTLAKEISTLDTLSEGRIILGVGSGPVQKEYNASGLKFSTRGKVMEETIEIMRGLWKGKLTYNGKHYKIAEADIGVRPAQKGGPPIWIGAEKGQAINRVATHGDGWLASAYSSTNKTIHELLQKIIEAGKQHGRDLSNIPTASTIYTAVDSSFNQALTRSTPYLTELYGSRIPPNLPEVVLMGTSSECTRRVEEREEAGVKHLILIFSYDRLNQMKQFARNIIPSFTK